MTNRSLTMLDAIQEAFKHKTDKKAPPEKLKKGQRDGAEIREVVDKNMWSHDLVKSIPSSATLWPMVGIALPQVKNIETAIQHYTSILNGDMLSQLPGSLMSLGSMFSKLGSSGALDQIKNNMEPEAAAALDTMMNLIPSVELSESGGYSLGNRVHEETFLENANNLLSQCRTIGDVTDVLTRLTSDETLHGKEKLGNVSITANTAFGELEIIITYDGRTTANINIESIIVSSNTANVANTRQPEKPIEKNMKSFVGTMTSPSQSFAMSGENMFGDSATQLFDMFNRLSPDSLKTAKEMVETLSTGQKEQNHLKRVAEKLRDSGKMLTEGFK